MAEVSDYFEPGKVLRVKALIESHQFGQLDFTQRLALVDFVCLVEELKLSIGPGTGRWWLRCRF